MRYELGHGDCVHSVELKELSGNRHLVRWTRRGADGVEQESGELELDVRELGEGSYSVLHGHDVHDVRVERNDARRTVELADGAIVLEYLDPLRTMSRKGAKHAGPATVSSPIPGRVVRVPVSVGDEVAEGQPVVVVEAMKMANELRSPIHGRVTAIRAAAGATVEAGAPLVVVEPLAD